MLLPFLSTFFFWSQVGLAATPTALPTKPISVKFCAVGDILLDRNIRKAIEAKGPDFPLAEAQAGIQGHDLAFCNLESSLSTRGTRVKGPFRFRGDLDFAKIVQKAGFNLASVANNHTLDYGRDAFLDTMDALRAVSITPIGGGIDQAAAIAPTIVQCKGLRIAFIGDEAIPLDGFTDQREHAHLPGPAQATIESIEASVRKAKAVADVVVVSEHWGIEYHDQPTAEQVAWAHRIIDAGACLVLGHHPHVLEPMERYHGGFILYSLGNFVFDQVHATQTRTVLFECELRADGLHSPRIHPYRISLEHQPRPALKKDAEQILAWVHQLSKPFGTRWATSELGDIALAPRPAPIPATAPGR